MIHVTYERHGHTFTWLSCTTRKSLERWLAAIVSMGATNIHIDEER